MWPVTTGHYNDINNNNNNNNNNINNYNNKINNNNDTLMKCLLIFIDHNYTQYEQLQKERYQQQ